MNALFHSFPGSTQVSFTRSAEIAARFALIERPDDEGQRAILIFSRSALRSCYRLDRVDEADEMEECVWDRDIHDIRDYLLGVVIEKGPPRKSSDRQRNNRLCQRTLAPRAKG